MNQFIYPYILIENSLEVATYYKEMLNGEIEYVMLGKDTPNCPEDQLETVMHLQLKFNENRIYMADFEAKKGDFIQLHLDYEDKDEMIAVFNRFKKESKVTEELRETFWGAYFGNLIDKYGVTWQFHHTLPKK